MTQETYISRMWHKAALVVAAICVSTSAYAAEPFPDGGELQANVDYTIPKNVNTVAASFTPSSTGTITYTTGNYTHAYADPDHTEMIDGKHVSYDSEGTYELNVTKGKTIYFFCTDTFWLQSTFRITADAPIEIKSCDPKEGSVLSITDGFGYILINANQPVRPGTVTLSIDGTTTSKVISVSTTYTMTVEIPFQSTIESWLNAGTLKGGEDLTMTVNGIRNAAGALYNNGQPLVLKYKAPQNSVKIRNVTVPNPFMSYWTPGNPEAVLTASYSGNIATATYELTFGNQESEDRDYYVEVGSSDNPGSPAKVTIDGSIVKIDFAGKQRRPQDMVPSGTPYNNLVVHVTAWDEFGNPVTGEGGGQVGSFDRELNYQYISPAEFNLTFTPEPGTTLKDESTLELHLYDYDKISFDGVKFEIEGTLAQSPAKKAKGIVKTIIVPKSDITVQKGSSNDWTLKVPVPAEVQATDSKVIVTLENLSSTDGIDHTNDIRVVYNGFTITVFELYDPEGQLITDRTLSELPAGSKVLVIPNIAEEYPDLYMEYEIVDIYNGQTEVVKTPTWLVRDDDGFDIVYEQEVTMAVKMVRGHEYRFVFTAWPNEADRWGGIDSLGEEYVVFNGASEPFKYSSIQFVSVDPENETEIEDNQTEFTLVYDGLVMLSTETSFINYGQGTAIPFKSIVPVEPEESGYANTWVLTIPDDYISTYGVDRVNLTVVATDEDGRLVEGNEGYEETSFTSLTYPVAGFGITEDFYVLPSEETVESLQDFTVGSDSQPTGLTYDSELTIDLFDIGTRQTIYTFNSNDMTIVSKPKPGVEIPEGTSEEDTNYYTTVVTFSLPSPITDKGAYSLNIPEGFFTFGSQFTTSHNAVRSMSYEILGEPEPVEYTVTPAEGSVKELNEITIDFPYGPGLGYGKASLIIDGGEPIALNDPEPIYPEDIWTDFSIKYVLTLPETYTANGTYEVVFPRGFFNGDDGDYPEIRLTYVIGSTGIDAIFGDAEIVNVFTFDGRQLVNNGTADDIKALAPGFYIINGRKVVLK